MARSMQICFGVLLVGTLGCFVATVASWGTVAIDLGTTDVCAAVYRNGYVEIIKNDIGERTTPAYVSFLPNDVVEYGAAAKLRGVTNKQSTIFGVKRLIGRKFDDPVVQAEMQLLPYKITKHFDGYPGMDVSLMAGRPRVTTPVEVSTMFFAKMTEFAEATIGERPGFAVITVPAHFNDEQRDATKRAAIIAGLNPRVILDEPSAVAIAYDRILESGKKNVLVYDLGGGSFDASVLSIDNGQIQLLSTSGDIRLGGENFEERVVEYFIQLIKEKYGVDISTDISDLNKLRGTVEYYLPFLNFESSIKLVNYNIHAAFNFSETLTRDKFEELNEDLFNKTMQHVVTALSNAKLSHTLIDKILLSGKCTRIPKVQHLLEEYFYGKKVSMGVDPEVAVAFGAAVEGAKLESRVGRGKDGGDRVKLQIV